MISIKPPRVRNSATLSTFDASRPELVTLRPLIRNSYIEYLADAGDPNVLKPIKVAPDEKESLLTLYKSSYKKRKNDEYRLNWIYDLRNGDNMPYCPMCGNVGRDALDHYLPESLFPEFAFFSYNLVPTCTACNGKRSNKANAPGVQLRLLHPYFDGKDLDTPILTVKIIGMPDATGSVTYAMPSLKLAPYIPLGDPLYPRLENHIARCVSKAHFIRWVKGRWKLWRDKAHRFKSLPKLQDALKKELAAEITAGGVNNWTAAFLRGLVDDPVATDWLRLNP